MYGQEMTETTGFKQCHSCSAELLDRDKYCRRCGICQSNRTDPSIKASGEIIGQDVSDFHTRPLTGSESLRCGYSGSLVSIMTQRLSGRTSPPSANRWEMRLVSALVAVPLWLMIVLLSPLDAFLAARAIVKQV